MVLTGLTVYLSSSFKTSQQKAAEALPPPESILTASLQEGVLENTLPVTCTVNFKNQTELKVSGTEPGAQYTSINLVQDETLDNGSLVAEVNGQPVFILIGGFSFYRDLPLDAKGPDALLLNQALTNLGYQLPRSGFEADQITVETYRALGALYRSFGYPAPQQDQPIVASSFIVLKEQATVITPPRETGEVVERPLALLSFGQKELACTIKNQGSLVEVTDGQQVRLREGEEKTYPLTLTLEQEQREHNGESQQGQAESWSESDGEKQGQGKYISLQVPEEDLAGQTSFSAQVILSSSGQPGLLAPASALISTGQGTVLQVEEGEETRQVAVTVTYSARGYSLIQADPSAGIGAGTVVRLHTER